MGGFPASTLRDTQGLLSGTYHGVGMLFGYLDVGFATALAGASGGITPATLGVQNEASAQVGASDHVSTYPCDGETGIRRVHGGENPSPIPGADLTAYGPALIAKIRGGQSLVITEWTIAPAGGARLATTLRTHDNDPNRRLDPDAAVLIPNSVLAPNTTYNVVLKGTNAGVPFEKRYSFNSGNSCGLDPFPGCTP